MLAKRGVLSPWARQCSQLCRHESLGVSFTSPVLRHARHYSQHQHGNASRSSTRNRYALLFGTAATAILGLEVYKHKLKIEASESERNGGTDCNPLARVPFRTLLRGYFVYTCCSIPILVDCGPAVVDWCKATPIPGVWACFEFVVRNTFFPQVSTLLIKE